MKTEKIRVAIEFAEPITEEQQQEFIRLLDEELSHFKKKQRLHPKTPGRGWGIGTALVVAVRQGR